jgi:hypothetical protein
LQKRSRSASFFVGAGLTRLKKYMLVDTLRRICELQPRYSSKNTAEMQERGKLVRRTLVAEVETLAPRLRAEFGLFGDDLIVEASDGIGRKTEAPWVRIASRRMSPDPRHGFYAVLHFAADGTAVFVTIGCAATEWTGGDLKSLSDSELRQKTEWVRRVVIERFGSIKPFVDQIALGTRAALPKAFEKATACAKRLDVHNLDEPEIVDLLNQSAARLAAVYEAQRLGQDIAKGEQVQHEQEAAARALRRQFRFGQGFRLSSKERDAIASRAMTVAEEWLTREGYACTNTSKTKPFDFMAERAGVKLKVEVKGTTAERIDTVFMTKNEVALHREEKGQTALLLVSHIALRAVGGQIRASGGQLTAIVGWDIDEWTVNPIAYQLSRRDDVARSNSESALGDDHRPPSEDIAAK